jgi:hypothetical protein
MEGAIQQMSSTQLPPIEQDDARLYSIVEEAIHRLALDLLNAEVESTGYSDMYRDDLRRAMDALKRVKRYY